MWWCGVARQAINQREEEIVAKAYQREYRVRRASFCGVTTRNSKPMCELLLVPSQPSTHPRCVSFCFCLQSYNSHGEEGGAWQPTGLATKIKQSNRKKITISSFLLWGHSFCLLTFRPSCNSLTQSKVSVWVGRMGWRERTKKRIFFSCLSLFKMFIFIFFTSNTWVVS